MGRGKCLLLTGLMLLFSCSRPEARIQKVSDGTFTAEARGSSAGYILVTISSVSGEKVYSEEIRALAWQGYSLKLSKDSFVLDTSDTGPVRFLRDQKEAWFSMNALHTVSPDRTLVAYAYWNDYQNRHVMLALLEAGTDFRNAGSVLQEIPIKLKVSELVDAVEWVSPKKLIIKGDDRSVAVEADESGTWSVTGAK